MNIWIEATHALNRNAVRFGRGPAVSGTIDYATLGLHRPESNCEMDFDLAPSASGTSALGWFQHYNLNRDSKHNSTRTDQAMPHSI